MISCTEFIPCYSELFTYLEEKHGRSEVDRFWAYLFQPNGEGIPLINFLEAEGIRGCWSYWANSLNEEAADFTMYLNEKRGYYYLAMHHCPSKGRLLQLKEDIGIVPYHEYCLHCDCYRAAVEKVGLKYLYNFKDIDKASCSILIYDEQVFDGRVIIDDDTLTMERKASDNEYFHQDFHSSLNNGIEYIGLNYGMDAVKEFLERYAQTVHRHTIDNIKKDGLSAIRHHIEDTYRKEKAEEVLTMKQTDNNLSVKISYCPGVRHLTSTGRVVSKWYRYTTETVMNTFAVAGGLEFVMEHYDEATGAAVYSFGKKGGQH